MLEELIWRDIQADRVFGASVGAINPITKPIAVNRIIIARFSDQTLHANL